MRRKPLDKMSLQELEEERERHLNDIEDIKENIYELEYEKENLEEELAQTRDDLRDVEDEIDARESCA